MVHIELMVHVQRRKKNYTLWRMGENDKRIFKKLHCTKFNEIKISHSDIQKHVLHKD